MTYTLPDPNYLIGVVGAGAMGRGIAQVAAEGGYSVRLMDASPGIAEEAKGFITKLLNRKVEKGKLEESQRDAILARIRLGDALEALADCDLVIEAVVEKLAIKQQIFRDLEQICRPDAILASNTSALPIAAIGATCAKRERIAGMHFMNPVPLMKLVEVIHTPLTSPRVMDVLVEVGQQMGKTAIRVKDGPAFLAGNCARAFYTEALRFSQENIASPEVIDRIVRDAGGFRMGPFELMDMIGLDVNYPGTKSLFEDFFFDPRYRPTPEARLLTEAGLLGRKSGQGFYRYDNNAAVIEPEMPISDDMPWEVWLWGHDRAAQDKLQTLATAAGVNVEDGDKPSDTAIALVAPMGEDASTTAARIGLNPERTVAVDTLYGWKTRRTVMAPPGADPKVVDQAMALLGSDGVAVSRINDSPGFVMPRLQAVITNLACDLCQQTVGMPEDVDLAMRLGFNFPEGPLAAGDRLGSGVTLALIQALHDFYGDDRYRPSPWLRRREMLGLSLKTLERR
ncbi:MAG: 3-hydroxyacyl-CoA dehydrogenase [Phycisphaeraceae bacterium]